MNKKTLSLIIIAVVASGLIIGLWLWWSSPRRQITKTLETVATLSGSALLESPEEKLANATELVKYFAPAIIIEWPGDEVIPAGRWEGTEQIYNQVLSYKNKAIYKIKISDLVIQAARGQTTATAEFNLTVSQQRNFWAWQAVAELTKVTGRWQIAKLNFMPVIQK